jgi:carbamoyl-phosphate synthase large subunit
MQIVYDEPDLRDYLANATVHAGDATRRAAPLLVDRFLDDAVEIDVDALYDGTELYLAGVMEHVEEAGIHSGDSACVLPPVSLSAAEIARIRTSTEAIAKGVGVRGLIIIEANPRASRTVPFVAKATGVPLARAAARLMAGESIADLRRRGLLAEQDASVLDLSSALAVKEAVLPFKRFATRDGQIVDSILGPEMRSTGEVMGVGATLPIAFAKSQTAAFGGLPTSGRVFVSVADRDKRDIVLPSARLVDLGFELLATDGTAAVLHRHGIPSTTVRKHSEGTGPNGEPTIIELITNGSVDMVVNTPSGQGARADGYEIRGATTAVDRAIITTTAQFAIAVRSIEAERAGAFDVASLQELDEARRSRRETSSITA